MKHAQVPQDFKSPYMKQVSEHLSILKMDDTEWDDYYLYMKKIITQRDAILTATRKGEAKGLAKGKAEVAKQMHTMGLDLEIIAKATQLPGERLQDLLK